MSLIEILGAIVVITFFGIDIGYVIGFIYFMIKIIDILEVL